MPNFRLNSFTTTKHTKSYKQYTAIFLCFADCASEYIYIYIYIYILVINQLDAKNLFYNKFISCLYMFRAPCAHRQEVPEAVQYNFDLLTMSIWCSKHVEA